jgi:hypothetical protein
MGQAAGSQSSSGPLATTPEGLGEGLRRLRSQSLRDLVQSQPIGPGRLILSKSQLSRYETGQTTPPAKLADHLDRLYGGTGWVARSIEAMHRQRARPPEHRLVERRTHTHLWPASFSGDVWVDLRFEAGGTPRTLEIRLDWGPWTQLLQEDPTLKSLRLVTGKSADASGVAAPINVQTNLPVAAAFGCGEQRQGGTVRDIRLGWEHR